MLGFQYKPLESKFLAFCKKNNQKEILKKYQKVSYAKRIHILDMYASFLGL